MFTKETIDVLLYGIKNIEKFGWIRGAFGGKDTGFCIAGSMRGYKPYKPFVTAVHLHNAYQCIQIVTGDEAIGGFNDTVCTNKEEVINWMLTAVSLVKSELNAT